jgi:arylsulfatase A-like enzyme
MIWRSSRQLLGAVVLVLGSLTLGCGGTAPTEDQEAVLEPINVPPAPPAPEAPRVDLATLTLEPVDVSTLKPGRFRQTIPTHGEWRDCRSLAGPSASRIDLGPVGDARTLRLGVTAPIEEPGYATMQVFVGEEQVADLTYAGGIWEDYRVNFPETTANDAECRLEIRSDGLLHLAGLELVPPRSEAPNVLVYMIDTLRLDKLGCYGYERNTSPNLDALASDGLVCTQLLPQSSWTRPSVGSLLTGVYPHVHGAQDRGDVLKPDIPHLADALEYGGYRTVGFMTNPNCLPFWGFGKEFDRYVDANAHYWKRTNDSHVTDLAIDALDDVEGRPWFLYVHTMGPHGPYEPPAPYDTQFNPDDYDNPEWKLARKERRYRRETLAAYDGEIAFTDAQFGRLVDELKARGEYDNTLIIVVSDHGEEFWEHGGMDHGHTLYEELVRVPFIVKLPGGAQAGGQRDHLVEMIDLAPTILDILDLPPVSRFQGMSVKEMLKTDTAQPRIGYTALLLNAHSKRGAKTPEQKYIIDRVESAEEWFDLVTDPTEQNPLDAPFTEDAPLRMATSHIASQGASGLHVMFTSDSKEAYRVSGTIAAVGLEDLEINYPKRFSESSSEPNHVQFKVSMPEDEKGLGVSQKWRRAFIGGGGHYEQVVADGDGTKYSEQDNAHLRMDLPLDAELRFDLRVNGQPVDPSLVRVGARGTSSPLTDATITVAEMLAEPDQYDPAALPRGFGVYVWYVPSAVAVDDSEVPEEMLEVLKALGYTE